jgi:hypothetical protein
MTKLTMTATVTCYVCRRERPPGWPRRRKKVTYQVWLVRRRRIVTAVPPVPAFTASRDLRQAEATEHGSALTDALADVAGSRAVEAIWHSADDLSEGQVAAFVAGLPDTIQSLTAALIATPLDAAGMAPVVASLGADLTSTLLLSPVLEPLETTVHAFEIVGVAIGVLTGLHVLTLFCVKHLAHDKLSHLLSSAFKECITGARKALEEVSVPQSAEVLAPQTEVRAPEWEVDEETVSADVHRARPCSQRALKILLARGDLSHAGAAERPVATGSARESLSVTGDEPIERHWAVTAIDSV